MSFDKIIGTEIELDGKTGIAIDVKPYTGSGQFKINKTTGLITKRNAVNIKVQFPDKSTEWIKGVEIELLG